MIKLTYSIVVFVTDIRHLGLIIVKLAEDVFSKWIITALGLTLA